MLYGYIAVQFWAIFVFGKKWVFLQSGETVVAEFPLTLLFSRMFSFLLDQHNTRNSLSFFQYTILFARGLILLWSFSLILSPPKQTLCSFIPWQNMATEKGKIVELTVASHSKSVWKPKNLCSQIYPKYFFLVYYLLGFFAHLFWQFSTENESKKSPVILQEYTSVVWHETRMLGSIVQRLAFSLFQPKCFLSPKDVFNFPLLSFRDVLLVWILATTMFDRNTRNSCFTQKIHLFLCIYAHTNALTRYIPCETLMFLTSRHEANNLFPTAWRPHPQTCHSNKMARKCKKNSNIGIHKR